MENYEILWNSISKIINLVKMSYKNFRYAVEHECKLSKWFAVMSGVRQGCVMSGVRQGCVMSGVRQGCVMSGVRQGCVMSGFLFVLVIDWIMRKTTRRKR